MKNFHIEGGTSPNKRNVFPPLLLFPFTHPIITLQYIRQFSPMGNSLPTPTTHSQPKLHQYVLVRRLAENRSLMQSSAGRQVVVVEHTFPSEEQLENYTRRQQGAVAAAHQFYLSAFDYEIISMQNICSRQFRLLEYFAYEGHTLREELASRAASGKEFSVQQVMSILCSVVLAMSHFLKHELLHYTLNPTDIVIDKEGVCKVIAPALSENIFDHNPNYEFYYAPETMKLLRNPHLPNALTAKSGVFTLGVTLLGLLALRPMTHLYNHEAGNVQLLLLQEELRKVKDADLQSVLKQMLKVHSYERITFTQLEEMLFEIISRPKQAEGKLEDSIVKIRQDHSRASEDSYFTRASNAVCLQLLDKDEEDQPQLAMAESMEDEQILDEYEQPMGGDWANGQSRMQLGQSNSKAPLTEHSDRSNIPVTNRKKTAFEQSHYSKSSRTELPEYVSETLPEGRYEGYKLGGMRHGFGSFYYADGGKYCGEWVRNRMQGRGVLYYASGKIAYEGEWRQDQLDGYGVLYNEHIQILEEEFDCGHLEWLGDRWIKYEGYFQDDVKHGQGTLFLSNGESYRGAFENDQPHGMGQFRNVRGETVRGCWLMGALNL